jgi:hypothetical protein
LTHSKTITQHIVELWGLGYSAEETVEAFKKKNYPIGLATVYRHRNSLTAKQIIDELMRKQLDAIAKSEDPSLSLKYRNELLKMLIPQRIETDQQITQLNLTTPFDADPEMKRLLLDAAAKQKAEKDASQPFGPGP